ncbi:uncharacterized protein FSUBG_10447 [Fusarium subglutinans]|uniref:Uncharacterized protein n=1 Tax=Gibberella subglutinans TaxID=42677 RepID=A0A8H5P7I4_GIBSU|nr:uncharacterized protein FSUBG_10447 [Fusarium subglutinans]KAF5591521.1 hypothetical protein FSUBG_10447 [Fusarium subglutinans]
MSDPDTEMSSYPETPPPTTQTIQDSPKTACEDDDTSPSPRKGFGKPIKPRPIAARRPRAASSSTLPSSRRYTTPPQHPGQQVTDIPSYRVEKRRPAASGHKRAESFEHYLSSTRRLTRRNPSNDEITTVGFANGLLPRRGQALAPTSGSALRESPPLPRRHVMEQLGKRVEDLQMTSRGRSDGSRSPGPHYGVAFSTRATEISSRRPGKAPEEDVSPIVSSCHWSDESD